MSAKHCGRSGSRRWPTCPAGIPAHLQVLGSLLPITPSSVGRESWGHSDLRKKTQLSPPREVWGRGQPREGVAGGCTCMESRVDCGRKGKHRAQVSTAHGGHRREGGREGGREGPSGHYLVGSLD